MPCTSALLTSTGNIETRSVSHVPCTITILLREILKHAAFHTFLVLILNARTRSVSHVPCTSTVTSTGDTKTCIFSDVPCTSAVLVQEILKRAAFHTFLVLVQY